MGTPAGLQLRCRRGSSSSSVPRDGECLASLGLGRMFEHPLQILAVAFVQVQVPFAQLRFEANLRPICVRWFSRSSGAALIQ